MQERAYRDLHKSLYRQAEKKQFPLSAMLELTYRCNFRCLHCYVPSSSPGKDEMNASEVFSILEQLRRMGCYYLGFTGGEIFLRQDIFEIIFYAKRLGFDVGLLTNGSLINEKCADRLKALKPNAVEISILGASRQTFEKISKVKDSFGRVYGAVALLKKRNIPVTLKTCAMKPNLTEIAQIKKFAQESGLRLVCDANITPRNDGNKGPVCYRLLPEDSQKIMKKLYPGIKKPDKEKNKTRRSLAGKNRREIFLCGAGKTTVAINPYGEMKLCLEIPYPGYNVLKGSLKEGWRKCVEFVENFKPGPDYKCAGCSLADYCYWCPGKGFLEKGSLGACSPYYRELAIVRARSQQDKKALRAADVI